MNAKDIIKNGLVKENPTWVLILGMCPTLATTTSAKNGMMMGLATAFVLMMSNIVISLLKSVIPDKVRIPAFIVVIATFVTIVQMVMQGHSLIGGADGMLMMILPPGGFLALGLLMALINHLRNKSVKKA